MDTDILNFVIYFFTGLVVGFINTLSGSGSLISLPVLIFLGVPPGIANGSNRIAILLQSLVGLLAFKKEKIVPRKPTLTLSIPFILGAIPGAFIATQEFALINFEKILGIIFIIIIPFIIFLPDKFNKPFTTDNSSDIKPLHFLFYFILGLYGGFLQAGVGIFLLFLLVSVSGFDLIRANVIKLFLTFIFTPLIIIIFWQYNQIDWIIGLVLGAGSMFGAYIAVKTAIKKGIALIKWLVIIMIMYSAVHFIFIL